MRLLVLPVLVPFVTAIVVALLNGHPRLERAVSLLSASGLTIFVFWLLVHVDRHGPQVTVLGGWSAPWGIAFVADRLSAIMLCLSMSVGTVALLYTFWTVEPEQERHFFHPLFQFVLLGVNWSFVTGDLFNLFVGYEVMLIASYGAMMVGGSRAQVRETLKYLAINNLGSTLFVIACGLVYATVGTLNMADLAERTAALPADRAAIVTATSMVLLVVFAMKAAAFPVFYWLPDSYPVVPAGLNGYFAGMLTKVGVYSLIRLFVMVFQQEGRELAFAVLLVLSGFTMLLGVIGAMCQWEIRRILAWHSISQVGYMLMGIAFASTPAIADVAVAAAILHVGHHAIVKSNLFLVGGIVDRIAGTQELKRTGGLLDAAPGVAGIFLLSALSLAGVPPFTGFVSKLALVQAGLAGGHGIVVGVSLVTGLLTLYSMAKIWSYVFWGRKAGEARGERYRGMMVPTAVLAGATLFLGVAAEPVVRIARDAAADLTDPTEYVTRVLGRERRVAPGR